MLEGNAQQFKLKDGIQPPKDYKLLSNYPDV